MDGIPMWLQAAFWGFVAGAALLVGAAVAWFCAVPQRLIAGIMAFGSGVLISALSFELMDEAYRQGGFDSTALGFLGGAAAYTLVNWLLARQGAKHRKRSGSLQPSAHDNSGSGMAIAVGALLDGIPESIVIGLSMLKGGVVSMVAVIAIFLSNVPEGLSSAAGMKKAGRSAAYIFGVWGAIAAASGLASLVGYTVFQGLSAEVVAATTAIAAGAILSMLVDTMIPEAFDQTHDFAGLITVAGFLAAFILSKMGDWRSQSAKVAYRTDRAAESAHCRGVPNQKINIPPQGGPMTTRLKLLAAAAMLAASVPALAQITLYEHDGWRGRAFTTDGEVRNLARAGFNDRASSVVVDRGQWEVCEDSRFTGRCVILRRGSYENLQGLGLNDRISSVRRVRGNRHRDNVALAPEPMAQPTYEYRRRANEQVYTVPVTSVHAVMGNTEQRCWVERQQVQDSGRSTAGTLAGAVIGGILGHQVGSGTGRDVATAAGAIGGAALGSNMAGRGGSYGQDVQRCANVPSSRPDYYDVTYNYRGIQHRIQMASDPGQSILVNRNGEPRQ
jgi:ZIP family zinc transporter